MNQQAKDDLVIAASNLYANLKADISNAGTRVEHIRLTTLAQEAENLYHRVIEFVRTETSNGPSEVLPDPTTNE
jgi:hypothetical protein